MSSIDAQGIVYFSSTAIVAISLILRFKRKADREIGNRDISPKWESSELLYDVAIVGAGPAGSTTAYFLGKLGLKVALFDKKQFPRHKPCGDAWCAPALEILEEMGVLAQMENDNVVKSVRRGGFISPFGYECINAEEDSSTYGSVTGCRTYAIKRYIADEYLVKAAASLPTVTLYEGTEVLNASYNEPSRTWSLDTSTPSSVSTSVSSTPSSSVGTIHMRSIMLVVCDGSTSYLGKKLNIIPKESQPLAVCSHSYIKRGSHRWSAADGVMIFHRSVLPGYSALFRHYNDDVYL